MISSANHGKTSGMNTPPIAIAGGGIAGLAASLALGSHESTVFESSPIFGNAGVGLQLGPNAVKALQKLGAWDAVAPITSTPQEIHIRDGITGDYLKRLKLGGTFERKFGAPYRVAHRADLHQALLSVVRARNTVDIQMGQSCSQVLPQLDGATLIVEGTSINVPALIMADGVNSALRQSLYLSSAAVDSGDRHHRSLVQCPTVVENCVVLWLYPRAHVVHYPVGAAQNLNVVAVVPQHRKPTEVFANACPDLATVLDAALPQASVWTGFYVRPLSVWAKGSTLLLGDAAHGTLPYLAQGAAMALEDAACLADALKNTMSLQHAFAETAQRRIARTTRLHMQSVSTGKTYHFAGLLRHARNAALKFSPDRILQSRLDWIYRYK
jgi:salicylate hydroxylase